MKTIADSIPPCVQSFTSVHMDDNTLQVDARCIFPRSFIGFEGHFPDKPILPAIVQLATVRHIAEKALEKRLLPVKLSRTKFKTMVTPDQEVEFLLKIKLSENGFEGNFSLCSSTKENIASGHYLFSEKL